MKSIKLTMAVFALAAAFTACTKEEVSLQQEVQSGEFVGAKVLATNVSANFDFVDGSQTKVDANGDWEEGDKLGLAWIVEGDNATALQQGVTPANNNIYANHLFTKGTDGFSTYGNVFEGWHFAYYPFQYMPRMGQEFKVNINPTQTEKFDTDKYTTRAYVSVPQFLTEEENVDTKNNKLQNVNYDFLKAVKMLAVNLDFQESVLTNPELNTRKILSVTLEDTWGGKIFCSGERTFEPTKMLVGIDLDNYNPNVALNGAWVRPQENQASITTLVDNDDINLGADQKVRIYTLPIAGLQPQPSPLKLIVEVEGGHFEIPFVAEVDENGEANEDCTNNDKFNNEAFRKLAFAYYKGETPYMASFANHADASYMNLDFKLEASKFVPHFNSIKSETEWTMAVSLLNTLNKDTETFKIEGNWAFAKDIVLPTTTKLTVEGVNGASLKLKGASVWPEQKANNTNKFIVKTNVVVDSVLNVNGLMKVEDNYTITNNGTINAKANANIKNLNNVNGRVIVEYGAQVTKSKADVTNQAALESVGGTVAYVVEDANQTTVTKINTLLNSKKVKVNTLIVKTNLNLKALAKPLVEGDVYGTDDPAAYLENLSKVTVELDGGSLTAATDRSAVGLVKAVAGTTAINGVDLALDKLIVEAGVMTATNVKFNDNDVITVAEGAELNVNFDTLITYYIKNIVNEGTLNINNVCLDVEKVDNTKGTMVIADGSHIFYSTEYKQGGTVTGTVLNAENCPEIVVNSKETLTKAIAEAAANTTIKLASNVNLDEALVFNKDMKLDLNGKTLNSKEYAIEVTAGTLTIKGNGVVYGNSDNSGSCSAVFANGGNVVIENGTFKVGDDKQLDLNNWLECNPCIYATGSSVITVNGGEFMYAGKNKFGCEWLLNCENSSTASIVVKGGKFHNFDPANITTYNPERNFVAAGFESVKTVTNTTTGAFYCTVVEED